MPTLQQYRYLVALSDTLHFRRAAEACHVTQPTLSAPEIVVIGGHGS